MATATRKTSASPQPAAKQASQEVPRAAHGPAARTAATHTTSSPVKTRARTAAKKAAPAAKAAAKVAAKVSKAPRQKKVRLGFAVPATDYALLTSLKARTLQLGEVAKKSALVRAALSVLAGLSDSALVAAVKAIPAKKKAAKQDKKPAKKPAKPQPQASAAKAAPSSSRKRT